MSLEAVIRRDRLVTAAGLLAVTALAWLYLFREPLSHRATDAAHGPVLSVAPMKAMAVPSSGEHADDDDSDLPD